MNHNQLSEILTRLQSKFTEKKLSTHELSNLVHDLEAVEARFQAGHYAHSDYIARNTYDIPRRTEEFLVYLRGNHQVAQIWTTILEPIITTGTHHVLDLCPGWSPKIELALNNLDFSGTVYLWDVDTASTQHVVDYLQLFKTHFNLSQIKTDLFSSHSGIKSNLIVANHIIDDLLLNEFCKRNQCELSTLYGSEEKMLTAIAEVMRDEKSPHEIAEKLVKVVENNLTAGGYFILSQYAGLFERANDLHDWVLFCKAIMESIRNVLLEKNYQDSFDRIHKAFLPAKDMYFSEDDVLCLLSP